MSFNGLSGKSVACLLLYRMGRVDFAVDTNVLRVMTRLGWLKSLGIYATDAISAVGMRAAPACGARPQRRLLLLAVPPAQLSAHAEPAVVDVARDRDSDTSCLACLRAHDWQPGIARVFLCPGSSPCRALRCSALHSAIAPEWISADIGHGQAGQE